MKIGLVQMKVEEEVSVNIEKINRLTDGYRDTIFLLPELFTTGFNHKLVKSLDESHLTLLDGLNDKNIFLGSIVRKTDKGYFNTFFMKEKNSVQFIYDKVHLFPLMEEDKLFKKGDCYATFKLKDTLAGCGICFDLRFSEQFFYLRRFGVKIVFLPAQWPKLRVDHFKALVKARAIENQIFFIACNAVGEIWDTIFGGYSQIVSPWGVEIINLKDNIDTVCVADIDLSEVDEVRKKIPME